MGTFGQLGELKVVIDVAICPITYTDKVRCMLAPFVHVYIQFNHIGPATKLLSQAHHGIGMSLFVVLNET